MARFEHIESASLGSVAVVVDANMRLVVDPLLFSLPDGTPVARGPQFLFAANARQVVRQYVPGKLAFDTHMPPWKRVLWIVQRPYFDPEFTNIRVACQQT